MWVVERDVGRRHATTLPLNVDVSRTYVANRKRVGRIVEGVSLLSEILTPANCFAPNGDRIGDKIEAKHVGGISVESRIGNRTCAIRDLADRRERAQQVGFICGSLFRNG